MQHYYVRVTAEIPFPVTHEYLIPSSNISVAIRRGVEKYRVNVREDKGKAKRIDKIHVIAVKAGLK